MALVTGIVRFRVFRCFLLLCILFASRDLYAQTRKKSWAKKIFDLYADTTKDGSKGLVPLPYIFYTPDTRWAAGGIGVYYFKLRSSPADSITRLSYVKFLADYTQNRQFDAWASWQVFMKEEVWLLKGEARYRLFPDRYYGIGNRSSLEDEERFSYELQTFKKLVMRRIYPKMFLGVDYQVTRYYNVEKQAGKELITGAVTGSEGSVNSGFGLVFSSDRRDNIFNSVKGHFFEVSTYFYDRQLGSAFSFSNYNVNFNKYHSMGRNVVFAWQVVGNFNTGDVPFYNLAAVGGDEILRGYARNRFRDLHFTGTQAEVRFPIVWRLGAAVFGGVGDVYRDVSDLSWDVSKYSYGAGLRFKVNRKENLNIRLDYGFGRDGNAAFYFAVGEAF